MGDVVRKLIGGAVTGLFYWLMLHSAYVPWGGHRRVEYVWALVALGDA